MANKKQSMNQLLESTRDENPHVRLHALQSLAKIEDPCSIPVLLAALNDSEPELRAIAATSLGKLRAGQAKWQLLELLGNEDARVRLAAIEALGRIADLDTVPGLSLILKRAQESSVRIAAAHALSKIGGTAALTALQAAARDDTPDVRRAALRAVETMSHEDISDKIVERRPPRWRFIWLLAATAVLSLGVYVFVVPRSAPTAVPMPTPSLIATSTTPQVNVVEVEHRLGLNPDTPPISLGKMEENAQHVLRYEEYKDVIRFLFEDIEDTTDDRDEFLVLYVDFNKNGVADEGSGLDPREEQQHLDHEFSITRDTEYLCAALMFGPASTSTCGGYFSKATFRKDFKRTGYSELDHIYWELTIPKSELADTQGNEAHIVVKFYRGLQWSRTYPEQKGPLFSSVFVLKWND